MPEERLLDDFGSLEEAAKFLKENYDVTVFVDQGQVVMLKAVSDYGDPIELGSYEASLLVEVLQGMTNKIL